MLKPLHTIGLLVALLLPLVSFGQLGHKMGWNYESYRDTEAISIQKNIPLDTDMSSQQLASWLASYLSEKKSNPIQLEILHEISSPVGRHLLFQQYYGPYPIYDATVKLNLDANGVTSIFDASIASSNWSLEEINAQAFELTDLDSYHDWLNWTFTDKVKVNKQAVIGLQDNEPVFSWQVTVHDSVTHANMQALFTPTGFLYITDLNSYAPIDTAESEVFMPDPLTTAGATYGGAYQDNMDGDTPALNNEKVTVDLIVTNDGGTFKVENDWVRIAEFDAPNIPPVSSASPVFNHDREASGFEDANALYHLTTYQLYMQSLGFTLVDYQIPVDVHARNGDDNSFFSSSSSPPRLYFGEGGVDDAEDADVVVHEYGHAISHSAAPGTNTGFERKALDEGFGDYIAASYSRSISEYAWDKVFTWDGHNEFWNGREADTDKQYPDDVSSSIHRTGEIWASALMDIWEVLGREITDKLAIQTMYGVSGNIKLDDAAYLFLEADTLLYGGAYFCDIYRVFRQRGLVDSIESQCIPIDTNIIVNAGFDTTICAGQLAPIGGNAAVDGDMYQWIPADWIADPAAAQTVAFPPTSTTYTLRRILSDGSFNQDEVTVNVVKCNEEAIFRNTEGFADGTAPLLIIFPQNMHDASLVVHNVLGQKLVDIKQEGQSYALLSATSLPKGVYVVSVQNADNTYSIKVLRN